MCLSFIKKDDDSLLFKENISLKSNYYLKANQKRKLINDKFCELSKKTNNDSFFKMEEFSKIFESEELLEKFILDPKSKLFNEDIEEILEEDIINNVSENMKPIEIEKNKFKNIGFHFVHLNNKEKRVNPLIIFNSFWISFLL